MGTLKSGTLVGERYLIDRVLGSGDVGTTYWAVDTRLFGRQVAVRVLRVPGQEARYRRELEALTAIRHPNVVASYDWGSMVDGSPFMVLELLTDALEPLEVVPLSDTRARTRAANIARSLGETLSAVHAHGIVHRDLKPFNIHLRYAGTPHEVPVIMDFGLASLANEAGPQFTPQYGYAAPEHLLDGATDFTTDVFSMAGVMYWVLMGRDPPKEFSFGIHAFTDPVLQRLSPGPRRVILRGLASDRSTRYSDARQFGQELAEALLEGDFAVGEQGRPLRVFLSHAAPDKDKVRDLHRLLVARGIDAWLDESKLIAGEDWQLEIAKAVRASDVVIICLSAAGQSRDGFVHKEIRWALDVADEKPEGAIFIIPARLDPCDLPSKLRQLQWVDLFDESGFENLLKGLHKRASGRQ